MSVALCLLAAAIWMSGRRRRSPVTPLAGASKPLGRVSKPLAGVSKPLGRVKMQLAAVSKPLAGVRMQRAGVRVPPDAARQVPLTLDLLAAALRSGQPVAMAVAAVAPVAGGDHGERLRLVAGLLRFGAAPAVAWASLSDSVLAPVGVAAARSAESGLRLARGFELLAAEMRDDAQSTALARAHRTGVWAMAPLGLCFLPAFACLGVLPVIIGIARGVLSGTV